MFILDIGGIADNKHFWMLRNLQRGCDSYTTSCRLLDPKPVRNCGGAYTCRPDQCMRGNMSTIGKGDLPTVVIDESGIHHDLYIFAAQEFIGCFAKPIRVGRHHTWRR